MLIVQGVQIRSNKSIASVSGSRVTFQDGSWCDVATGEVVNHGEGMIQVGGSSDAASEVEELLDTEFWDLDVVEIGHLPNYSLRILPVVAQYPDKADALMLSYRGPRSLNDTLVADQISSRFRLFERTGSGTSQRDIISGNMVGGIVSTGDLVVGSSRAASAGEVTLLVPEGTLLRIQGSYRDIEVGDVGVRLEVEAQGSGSLCVQRSTETQLNLMGSGDVSIDEASGSARVSVMDSGDVILGGDLDQLTVQLMGSGDFVHRGTARQAKLSLLGSGDIRVHTVTESLAQKSLGSGDIIVRYPPGTGS